MTLYLTDLAELTPAAKGEYEVIQADETIKRCLGCFGCWTKSPGQCVIPDKYSGIGIKMSHADELTYVSECCYGGFSSPVKAMQDRAISYVHPYFEIRAGQMHHKRRYDNMLTVNAYFYGDTTPKERETAKELLEAVARNLDGKPGELRFYETAQALREDICR